jgi:hypothetical protein
MGKLKVNTTKSTMCIVNVSPSITWVPVITPKTDDIKILLSLL